ncbi:MAG: S-adenosylmethionine:tRNA ribosyltransferase-isomerase [Chloroflexi bacterium]|nr:S-adenosylmethionine:tRNA ribosyltransferase-isomerase [Chloroflexota bacterium]
MSALLNESTDDDLRLSSYDYELPAELIAQTPAEPRDSARLMVLDRGSGEIIHRHIHDLPTFLRPGDLLVVNSSRVMPCRLLGAKIPSGGRVEILLLRLVAGATWQAVVGGHVRTGQRIRVADQTEVVIGDPVAGGRLVAFPPDTDVGALLREHGHVPLPPYIRAYTGDPDRYQTVYADVEGSAAAPTAGLHFTSELIARLRSLGVGWTSVVLHVGLDTFKPVTTESIRDHHIHTEWIEVADDVVEAVATTRASGGRVIAVGTTTVRALEHAAAATGEIRPFNGFADLFITPGYRYRVADTMLTNFHLPRSSLLLLVSAFAGRLQILDSYAEAIRMRYRFFSFGDAMLVL